MTHEELLAEVEGNLWVPGRKAPLQHGCDAAFAYLSLLVGHRWARFAKDPSMWGECHTRRANDIMRASGLEPRDANDPGVHKNLLKLLGGLRMEPVMLLSWDDEPGCVVADGFHRISAAYLLDPFVGVRCFVLGAAKPRATH